MFLGGIHIGKEEEAWFVERQEVWGTAGVTCRLKLAAAALGQQDILVCLYLCVCVCVSVSMSGVGVHRDLRHERLGFSCSELCRV